MTVRAVACTVEADSDHFALKIVLCHHGSHVGMVMLHLYERKTVFRSIFLRKCSGVIEWMHVADDSFRSHPEKVLETQYIVFVKLLVFDCIHVSEKLADVCERSFCQCKRILELAAGSEYHGFAGRCRVDVKRHRHVSFRTSDHLWLIVDHAHYGVVCAHSDLSGIVYHAVDERICRHHCLHFGFVLYHRHIRKVRTREYQWAYPVEQHVLCRKAGQEAADEATPADLIVRELPVFEQDYRAR